MSGYFQTVSSWEIGVGVASGAVAFGLMIWQAVDLNNHELEFAKTTSAIVVILTALCIILTYFEATFPTLGGLQPLYSMFVISTGLIATFLQTALLAVMVSLSYAYTLATSVLATQLYANSVMLAIIFSNVRKSAYSIVF